MHLHDCTFALTLEHDLSCQGCAEEIPRFYRDMISVDFLYKVLAGSANNYLRNGLVALVPVSGADYLTLHVWQTREVRPLIYRTLPFVHFCLASCFHTLFALCCIAFRLPLASDAPSVVSIDELRTGLWCSE